MAANGSLQEPMAAYDCLWEPMGETLGLGKALTLQRFLISSDPWNHFRELGGEI